MDFLELKEITVTRIALAICVHKGAPIHRNRPTHGLALRTVGDADYVFENGTVLHASPGSLSYLPKGASYTVREKSAGETYAINFELDVEAPFEPIVADVGVVNAIRFFKEAERAWRDGGGAADAVCRAALYSVIAVLQRKSEERYMARSSRILVTRAEHFIAQHYTDSGLRVGMIAAELAISEVYLRKLFEEKHGKSPASYIRACRMRRASELILSQSCTMREVAEQSGFGDYSYFCREFKRETGYAPTQYAAAEKTR